MYNSGNESESEKKHICAILLVPLLPSPASFSPLVAGVTGRSPNGVSGVLSPLLVAGGGAGKNGWAEARCGVRGMAAHGRGSTHVGMKRLISGCASCGT